MVYFSVGFVLKLNRWCFAVLEAGLDACSISSAVVLTSVFFERGRKRRWVVRKISQITVSCWCRHSRTFKRVMCRLVFWVRAR